MHPAKHNYMIDIVALICLGLSGYAYYLGDLITGSAVLGGIFGYYFGHRIKK